MHSKHTKLTKPIGGFFHENEIAIIGAPCSMISQLVSRLKDFLPDTNIGYVDADHHATENMLNKGYTDKISYHEYRLSQSKYNKRSFFAEFDIVIVNGNHFVADNQIVILNEAKKESLQRKLNRLTDIKLIISDNVAQPYEWLAVPSGVRTIGIEDGASIAGWLSEWYDSRIPSLMGGILVGGQSTRMGEDKALIDYHGKPQYAWLESLLADCEVGSVMSVATLRTDLKSATEQVIDTFVGLGPFGGILSIFRKYPDWAILTIPCDVPLIDSEIINLLIKGRDRSRVATCFYNPGTDFPEPLITIWEPRAYPLMLEFLSLGYSCPRKVLINSDIKMIDLGEKFMKLRNVNTPEDRDLVQKLIQR